MTQDYWKSYARQRILILCSESPYQRRYVQRFLVSLLFRFLAVSFDIKTLCCEQMLLILEGSFYDRVVFGENEVLVTKILLSYIKMTKLLLRTDVSLGWNRGLRLTVELLHPYRCKLFFNGTCSMNADIVVLEQKGVTTRLVNSLRLLMLNTQL